MRYVIGQQAESRSFPAGDAFLRAPAPRASAAPARRVSAAPAPRVSAASAEGEVVLYLGAPNAPDAKAAVLVELGTECLGVHAGEGYGEEGSNVLGFARYRNGDEPPSRLIELVVQPRSKPEAIAAARAVFAGAGFEVVVAADQAGRIVDRVVRPEYNAALRLSTRDGQGQGDGRHVPARARLSRRADRAGRARRARQPSRRRQALFEVYGTPGYAPARRAVVAKQRADRAGAPPLAGLTVLDFSTLLPGPMAWLMLAEAGATVIKIERPGQGDEMRAMSELGARERQLRAAQPRQERDRRRPEGSGQARAAAAADPQRRRAARAIPPRRHGPAGPRLRGHWRSENRRLDQVRDHRLRPERARPRSRRTISTTSARRGCSRSPAGAAARGSCRRR